MEPFRPELTIDQMLQRIEVLWADSLCHLGQKEAPGWHREVLEEREYRITHGEIGFSTWEIAEARIAARVQQN